MGSIAIPGYTTGRVIRSPSISRNFELTQHLFMPSTQTQLLASVLPMSSIFAPARSAYKYKYSAPGPYLQLRRSAVTLAFRLSTTGSGVSVAVSVGREVDVSVGGRAVNVSVKGMLVEVEVKLAVAVRDAGGAVGNCSSLWVLQAIMVSSNR